MPATDASYISWVDIAQLRLGGDLRLPFELRLVEGDGVVDPATDASVPFADALARIDALRRSRVIRKKDRKARFDGCAIRREDDGFCLEIRVGPTHYDDHMHDMQHPEETSRRAALGQERHGDPRRYLACGLGVLMLPTAADGKVLLGVRGGKSYAGCLHGPAGWLPFKRNVSRIDPAAHAAVECEEELGLTGLNETELLGIVSYATTYETDLVFTARAPHGVLEDLVLHRRWASAVDAHEHTDVVLVTPQEVLSPRSGRPPPLVPSTAFGLRALEDRLQ